jgi:16S rRNA U516 pseudouridylate synthase RsuA-like enzyme
VCLIPHLCRTLGVDHIVPVGRLDYTSEGLILLTDDGGLADRLVSKKKGSWLHVFFLIRVADAIFHSEKLHPAAERTS